MLWSDWKDRQTELLDKADYFDFMKQPSTAEWLRLLAEKVAVETPRKMLENYFVETFKAWGKDFAGVDQLRKSRVNAITSIILTSIVAGKLTKEIRTVVPVMQQMGENLENLTPLGIAVLPFRLKRDYKMRFYGMCFHYPLFVEGVFDESIRVLYLLMASLKGKSVTLQRINGMDLWKLKKEFQQLGFGNLFFVGWENRVRNSIAHARFRYDDKLKMIHFVDVDPHGKQPDYKRSFTLEQFSALGRQLLDVYSIIQDVIFMTRIRQLVLAPNIPQLSTSLLMPDIRRGLKEGILIDPNA